MAIEKPPKHPLPQDFRPVGGTPKKVETGKSWVTYAQDQRMDVWRLIEYNFGTRKPSEVNWYLRRNVGCRSQTPDRKNYIFTSMDNPGIIYLPTKPSRLSYTVPGMFNIIAQPSSMSCWATVATMMIMWKEQKSLSIDTAMAQCGTKWLNTYVNNTGLFAADHGPFATAAGFETEPLLCLPGESWEDMLKNYGPLAVVTANPFHARIMVGIQGDGSPTGTMVELIDPNGGQRYSITLDRFTTDFEAVSSSPRLQVWHY